MAHVRLFLALTLIAAGCALLIASYAPRPVGAVLVGARVHGSQSPFFVSA